MESEEIDDDPAEDVAGTAAEEDANVALLEWEEINGANVAEGVEVLLEEDVACNEDTLAPGNEDVRVEDVDVDIAVNGLELICVLLEDDVACNDTLEPGNDDVRIEDVDVDIAVNGLELICRDVCAEEKVVGAERVADTAEKHADGVLGGGEEVRVREDVIAGEEQCEMPDASGCVC